MIFAFTKSDLIGSKAIRFATNAPTSHFAVSFNEQKGGYGIVFHSSFHGVGIEWLGHFIKRNKIVFALRPKVSIGLAGEEELYQALVQNFYGAEYDWSLLPEFGYHALKQRFIGCPMPAKSKFGSHKAYLCTEIAPKIQEVRPEFFSSPLPTEMISPYTLYKNMYKSSFLEPCSFIG